MRRLRVSWRGQGWLFPWLVEEQGDPDGVRCVFGTWAEAMRFAAWICQLDAVPSWRSPQPANSARMEDVLSRARVMA